jgi:hypothetical protein
MLLYGRAINLNSMMSVIFDLAMHTMLQELEKDKIEESPPVMPDRPIHVGVPRKIQRQ